MPIFFVSFCFLYKKKKENQLYIKVLKKYPYKKKYYIEKKHLTNRYNWGSGNGEVCHWRQIQVNAMDNPTGDSTKAITRFLLCLLGAAEEVCLEGVRPLAWTPVSSVFWSCSRA